MAIKAKGQITLSSVVDVKATYRYYLLQSSTLSKPAKPTTFPPSSSWDDTEPTYTNGSTNSLYLVDCTVFCDDTFAYSSVSLSSSYEAAKAAYNLANNVQNNLNNNYYKKPEIEAKLEVEKDSITSYVKATLTKNLIRNGYGEYLNNTNFSSGYFVRGDCPEGCYGYFYGGTTEQVPFNPSKLYDYRYYSRKHEGYSHASYFGIKPYDVDGKPIDFKHILWFNKNLFYLAKDLKDGDTVAYFTDLTNWSATSQTYQRAFLIFGYTDSTGYKYPDGTYSQNVHTNVYENDSNVNKSNNTITLSSAWKGGTIPAGTCIGQASEGSTYCYYGQNGAVSHEGWKEWRGYIYAGDVGGSVTDSSTRLLYAKTINLTLVNWGAEYSGIYIAEHTEDAVAREQASEASAVVDSVNARVSVAETELKQLWNCISTLVRNENGASLMVQTENGWTFATTELEKAVSDARESLKGLTEGVDDVSSAVETLQDAVDDLGVTAQYVKITTYGDATEPMFKNLLPEATNADRVTIYGGDYDGDGDNDGYKTWTRLVASTTEVEEDVSAGTNPMCVTGYIPAKPGDVIRIKGAAASSHYTARMMSFKQGQDAYVKSRDLYTNYNSEGVWDWVTTGSQTYADGILTIPLTPEDLGTDFDAIRFSAKAFDENTIVTVNEEIVYGKAPCIELGESDSDFKLLITNKRIMFMDGSNEVTYISNQALNIKKAVIEEELVQGRFAWKARPNGNLGLQWIGG